MGTCWMIASGKGGVGKSTLASALGCALAQAGRTVCVVDADIGLRDQDALLSLENRVVYDLLDVLEDNCEEQQALIPSPDFPGLYLLAAAQFARVKEVDRKDLRRLLIRLRLKFDHVLVDCPAGMEKGVRNVLGAMPQHVILALTPDDVCLRDAERIAALVREKQPETRIIANRLQPALIRQKVMVPASVCAQTLELPLLGEVPEDPEVTRALLTHTPLMKTDCEAAAAIRRIAARMDGEEIPLPAYGTRRRGPLAWLLGKN